MNRKKYYVSIISNEISQIPYGNNDDFVIYATRDQVDTLRSKMNHMRDADNRSYWRSHVPIMQYSNDKANDDYDVSITEAFQLIYDLGDEKTKSHIKDMRVLTDKHM